MYHNEQFTHFRPPAGVLSGIPERLCVRPTVPDFRLECDEVIENWDDIDSFNTSIYSNECSEKLPMNVVPEFGLYDGDLYKSDLSSIYPPPNSPDYHELPVEEFPSHNPYVESLLQLWRDTSDYAGSSTESTQATVDESESQTSQSDSQNFSASSEQSDIDNSNNDFNHGLDKATLEISEYNECCIDRSATLSQTQNVSDTVMQGGDFVFNISADMMPLSQSSSRASSPVEMDNLSQSVLRLSFDNLRSISPRIERSPSPISSMSSSPRFLRSPSPFQVLNNSMFGAQMDDSADALVFYDDRYIYRSVSPRDRSFDHMVPGVDTDYQLDISMSEEFPLLSNRARRFQNSCDDQVVPEFIEE